MAKHKISISKELGYIVPGKTLLFLDEIQECPAALQALRYLKEKKPELHVIAAGSLLEFTLNNADFQLPVGRIEMLFVKPMSFLEFLYALDEIKLIEFIQTVSLGERIIQAIHEKLLTLSQLYFYLGGMPAVVDAYKQTRKVSDSQHLQRQLLNTYRNDFGKYASLANQVYLRRLLEKLPGLIAKQFKYVDVDPQIESRYLYNALQLEKQEGDISSILRDKSDQKIGFKRRSALILPLLQHLLRSLKLWHKLSHQGIKPLIMAGL